MNILLWVSPFQIAAKSLKYPELKGYLNKRDRLGELTYFRSVLSPWVTGTVKAPDVEDRQELCQRTGITETYVPDLVAGLIRDYHLDGLKIDFIFNGTSTSYLHTRLEPMVGEYEMVRFNFLLEEVGRSRVKSLDGGLNLSLAGPEAGVVELVRLA
jgi:hypothetical protein